MMRPGLKKYQVSSDEESSSGLTHAKTLLGPEDVDPNVGHIRLHRCHGKQMSANGNVKDDVTDPTDPDMVQLLQKVKRRISSRMSELSFRGTSDLKVNFYAFAPGSNHLVTLPWNIKISSPLFLLTS
ncbi:unnamed protein product [Clavelina lepadiformis]|uniref:Uncharacterized protein n=1 Tax=Clavelina lepadiformis TaxID=159417 RepID=A0ABP0GRK3_CLALP